MSTMVVDASLTLAWLLDDEADPRADVALKRLDENEALVPQLWHLETRNGLLTAKRRGRLTTDEVNDRLNALKGLPIRTDNRLDFQFAFELAELHTLSFYDAIYLELAIRREGELATLDRALSLAASIEGVMLSR